MGELVQEIPQEDEITEVQVPRLVQLPGTADRPAHSLGKAEKVFNFRLAGVLQQRHPTCNSCITGSLHSTTGCPDEQMCLRRPPFSSLFESMLLI